MSLKLWSQAAIYAPSIEKLQCEACVYLFTTYYHNGVEPEISEKNDPNQNCPNY